MKRLKKNMIHQIIKQYTNHRTIDIMNTDTRREAIKWWNTHTPQQLHKITEDNDDLLLVSGRPHHSLTGSEIEKIWIHCIVIR